MGLFFRSPCPSATPTSVSPLNATLPVSAALRSRNAFIHFLEEFRRSHNTQRLPVWQTAMDAARHWNHMSLHEKFNYIEAAHKNGYVYRTRDRRMNRVMTLLRKALNEEEHKVNLIHLSAAVKQMQLWKRNSFKQMWSKKYCD